MIDRTFPEVWDAAMQALAEMKLDIVQPVNKEGGLINTASAAFADDKQDCWNCMKLAWSQNSRGHRGKMTVFVNKVNDTQTELKIVSNFVIPGAMRP